MAWKIFASISSLAANNRPFQVGLHQRSEQEGNLSSPTRAPVLGHNLGIGNCTPLPVMPHASTPKMELPQSNIYNLLAISSKPW